MSHDTLLHRALRRPTGMLVGTRVTPDMLTVLRLTTGLMAGFCFASANGLMTPGAALAFMSALLDRADGELARQSGRFSRIGRRFDFTADCVATMAMFIGLGIGVDFSPWPPLAGIFLGVSGACSVAAIFILLYGMPPPMRASGRESLSRMFDPDDVMLILPLAIWCGGARWIVLASGLITPLVAILLGAIALARRGTARRSAASSAMFPSVSPARPPTGCRQD